jgi:hydroxymethylbilane synthase
MTVTTTTGTLRLGTRRSALALAQAAAVAETLRAGGHAVDLVEVVTEGDRSAAALQTIGGTGVFVTEIRRRLLDGDVDLAVHSLKDLPTADADGLVLAAVPPREDPRDALVTRDRVPLAALAAGARIGTGSPRRAAQLHRLSRASGRPLDVVPIRGNVDTRLRKVAAGELDGVVLAVAGLSRLGRRNEAVEVFEPEQMLPAPGQGALAVECRAGDAALAAALATALDDPETRAAVAAERALLAALEAGCSAPVGAHARVVPGDTGDEVHLRGTVVAVDGSHALCLSATGPVGDAAGVGQRLAARLLEDGAADLIGENP